MNHEQLMVVFLMLVALIVMVCLAFMWHADKDAELGRELRQAAGSESKARMAIESANLDRLIEQRYDNELAKARPRHAGRLPSNVTRIAPRIINRGRVVNFEPPGAA